MKDLRRGMCPICNHNEVWKTLPLHRDRSGGSSSRQRLAAVAARWGELTLYLCPSCGYAQWFVEGEEGWQAKAEPYVQRIRGRADSSENGDGGSAATEGGGRQSERYDVFLDDCKDVEFRVADALKGVDRSELLGDALSLVTGVKPVMVAQNVTFELAERYKQAINLSSGRARVDVSQAPPHPDVPEGEPIYDLRISQADSGQANSVALKLGELLSMDYSDGFKLALGKGFVKRNVTRSEAERIKDALEEVPTVVVSLIEKGAPADISGGVKCSICARVVHPSDTFFTSDGEVCNRCYDRHYR